METENMQYLVDEGFGGAFAFLFIGLVLIVGFLKMAWSGTLSEDTQRRNYRRDKEGGE